MGLFKFGKSKKIELEVREAEQEQRLKLLSSLKESVIEKNKPVGELPNNTEEAKKQIIMLIEKMPITRQEDDFKDDLERELYYLGYERECENAEVELSQELVLTNTEIEILKLVNNAISEGKITKSNDRDFLSKNIFNIIGKAKKIFDNGDLAQEKNNIDILKLIEEIKTEQEER